MNLIPTIALLSGLALADKLPAGAACGDNIDCTNNCLDSRWVVSSPDGAGKFVFVCNPALTFDALYYQAICNRDGQIIQPPDQEKTASACATVGGRLCPAGCVVKGSQRMPTAARDSWREACAAAGTTQSRISSGSSEGTAGKLARCP